MVMLEIEMQQYFSKNERIQALPPDVSERIAAGEVIEKPASAVKEMVENSIDAGASEIFVNLEDGGKGLIEVIDNGSGIHSDDLSISIKRHATSKLREISDLDKIHTLGFRGEALASIFASADVTITSRRVGQSDAFELSSHNLTPKKVSFGYFLDQENGTRILAESLFSKIPARLKFLRTTRSEVSAVREWIEKLSLTHPEISFKLTHNDKLILSLEKTSLDDRLRNILASGQDFPVIIQEIENPKIKINWFQGLSIPHSKKIIQIVNDRVLRDRLILQAILKPFKQSLLPGQFPALLIQIDLPPDEIDVNIHPSKTEVRFLQSHHLFISIQKMIETMIQSKGSIGFVPENFGHHSFSRFPHSQQSVSWSKQPMLIAHDPVDEKKEHSLPESIQSPLESPWKYQGILFRTYILFERNKELRMVDQHAAHERIRYEKLKNQTFSAKHTPQRQELLLPISITIKQESRQILKTRLEILTQMGFDAEIFSENAILFRSIPTVWGDNDLKTRLANLIEKLLEEKLDDTSTFDEPLFEKLASEACHSAVRAGDTISELKATDLYSQLMKCEHPWNCPHGRPTIVDLPKSRLEDWFHRLV